MRGKKHRFHGLNDMATKTRHVDENLKEELAEMVGATHGDVVYGEVRKVTKKTGGKIIVDVWIPTGDLVHHTFNQPKPPFDEWKFTHFAQAYGHGLVDLDGLIGSEVPVKYNGAWSVVVPEKPEPEKSFIEKFVVWYKNNKRTSFSEQFDIWSFLLFLPFAPVIFGLLCFDAIEGDTAAMWGVWGVLVAVLWVVLPLLFFLPI